MLMANVKLAGNSVNESPSTVHSVFHLFSLFCSTDGKTAFQQENKLVQNQTFQDQTWSKEKKTPLHRPPNH